MSVTEGANGVAFVDVAKAVQAESHLEHFLRAVEYAKEFKATLPKRTREVLEDCAGHSQEFDEATVQRMALDLSKYPSHILEAMQCSLIGVRSYITVEDEDAPCGIDEMDLKVIEGMLLFIQRLGRKSVRQLCQFLESANEGDYGYLVIASKGRESEIRTRPYLAAAVKAELDL